MRFFQFAFLLPLLCACSRPAHVSPATNAVPAPFLRNVDVNALSSFGDPAWEQKRLLQKTVQFFRGGEGLRANENPDEWLKLSPQQIIDKLTQDPRFGDMALDFNLYFLGFKGDRVKRGKTYDPQIYSFPAAVESARQLLAGGDYFRLFDLDAPAFLQPAMIFDRTEDEQKLPNLELFRKRATAFLAGEKTVVDFAKNDSAATVPEICERGQKQLNNFLPFFFMGLQLDLVLDVMLQDPSWYGLLLGDCNSKETTVAKLAADYEGVYNLNTRFFKAMEFYADDSYQPANLMLVQPFDLKALGINHRWISWGFLQKNALANSSTNMNRKRAAYVLKRYFCDDLTPVGIEDGGDHTGGAHGSQPSCRSCHYKLDPMAGYFRSYGRSFRDFSMNRNITFDDGAKVNLEQYESAWLMPPGSPRKWNVGYVRSVSDETLNDYGSTLDDLHANFRSAPEVKACLVKRMFEYALGDSQTVDPGFLDGIAKEFSKRAAADSAAAFKWLAAQAALSNTFRQADPVPNQCYDLAPGADPANSPPCRVAFLLERNCVHCHKSTSDHGNLDLKDWQSGPDGKKTFPHLGDDGKPVPLQKTLENIVARLITTNPEDRMPSSQYMSAQDRQALYLWAQETLNSLKVTR